jgi:hypothetical protein
MHAFLILYHAILVALAVGRTLDQATSSSHAAGLGPHVPLLPDIWHTHSPVHGLSKRAIDIDAVYFRAMCAGQKLFQAMITDVDKSGRYITLLTSPFDGNLVDELKAWGYADWGDMLSSECNFEEHGIREALTALGIDKRSTDQDGPNQCFHVRHENGPAVLPGPDGRTPADAISQYYTGPDKKLYRASECTRYTSTLPTLRIQNIQVTGAWATIGINPTSGVGSKHINDCTSIIADHSAQARQMALVPAISSRNTKLNWEATKSSRKSRCSQRKWEIYHTCCFGWRIDWRKRILRI